MEKETMGTVISVTKQWIDGKDYICRKWIGAGNKVPDKGTTIKVTYYEDKPSKARIEL